MPASALLRASRIRSGLSQAELAARAKTSQPDVSSLESGRRVPTVDTLERLLRQTGHRLIVVPGFGTDADEAAERIRAAGLEGREAALRAFLDLSDSLARAEPIDRLLATALEPRPTGSVEWDAALAALVDYWLGHGRLPRPAWVSTPSRTLAQPATPHLGRFDLEPDLAEVPPEFLRRNVLLERSTLASA